MCGNTFTKILNLCKLLCGCVVIVIVAMYYINMIMMIHLYARGGTEREIEHFLPRSTDSL